MILLIFSVNDPTSLSSLVLYRALDSCAAVLFPFNYVIIVESLTLVHLAGIKVIFVLDLVLKKVPTQLVP